MEKKKQPHRRVHTMSLNTLDPAVFAYIERQTARMGWSPESVPIFRGNLLQFSAAYGRRPWNQLTEPWVETWKESLRRAADGRDKGYEESVRRDKQYCVRAFLRWLAKNWKYEPEGGGKKVPVRDVSEALEGVTKVTPPNTDHKRLTVDEVEAILVAATQHSARAFALVALMLYPGLRRCEPSRMLVGDYHGGNVGVRGKGGKPTMHDGRWEYPVTRTVPVGPQCKAAIERWLDERGRHSGPMFPGRPAHVGLSPQQIGQEVDEVMWASGVKKEYGDGKSCHALRHTCITDALNLGQPLHIVQKLAGHTNPATTGRYTHVDDVEMLGCVDRPQYRALRKPAAEPAPEGKPRVRRQSFRRGPAAAA